MSSSSSSSSSSPSPAAPLSLLPQRREVSPRPLQVPSVGPSDVDHRHSHGPPRHHLPGGYDLVPPARVDRERRPVVPPPSAPPVDPTLARRVRPGSVAAQDEGAVPRTEGERRLPPDDFVRRRRRVLRPGGGGGASAGGGGGGGGSRRRGIGAGRRGRSRGGIGGACTSIRGGTTKTPTPTPTTTTTTRRSTSTSGGDRGAGPCSGISYWIELIYCIYRGRRCSVRRRPPHPPSENIH